MNMFKSEQTAYVAECYVPLADVERVKMGLDKATVSVLFIIAVATHVSNVTFFPWSLMHS